MYFLGQKIDYYKPLRHLFDESILNQIEPSEELILNGWTKSKVKQLIAFKGFIDPNYPNQIRTPDLLISLDKFLITSIDPIQGANKKAVEKLPVFYRDFSQNRHLIVPSSFSNGITSEWMEEDLKYAGLFQEKEEEDFLFSTDLFVYRISKKMDLVGLYHKETNSRILSIQWTEEGCVLNTLHGFVELNNAITQWLSFYNRYLYYALPLPTKEIDRVGSIITTLQHQWMVHPNVWKTLNAYDKETQQFFTDLWQDDWSENSIYLSHDKRRCKILGWRFLYIWDGLILVDIRTPDDKKISEVKVGEKYLVLNQSYKTSLSISRPIKVTDLVEGNRVSILPKQTIFQLTLHPHAIQRYEQRIDEHSLLILMLEDILQNVYHQAVVVEGAHTSDRRKVETSRYGYVISDDMVISVWDKTNNKKKKKKTAPKVKCSKQTKHIEYMAKLFEQLNTH